MPAAVEIRDMQSYEVGDVLKLWNSSLPYDQRDEEWFRSTVLPKPGDGVALVAECAGQVAGFVATAGENMTGLAVAKSMKRQGIGLLLLNAAVAAATEKKRRRLCLSSHNYWCAVPGIDSRYAEGIGFLEDRGFVRGKPLHDVSLEFGMRPIMDPNRHAKVVAAGIRIVPYDPDMLPAMRSFMARLNRPGWLWKDWEDRYSRPSDAVRLLALRGSEAVGWVDGLVSPNGTGGINYIAVVENLRRKGIGSDLLSSAVQELKKRGARSGFAGNVPAPFYISNGWRTCRDYLPLCRDLSRTSP